jgi:hypothetical protein
MEDKIESIQPIVNSPIIETVEKKSSKKIFIVGFIILIILVPIVMLGIQYFGNSNKNSVIVVNQKNNSNSPALSISANNASDSQIDKDIQSIDNELNNLDKNLDNVDQGLNDTQVNLQ